MSVRRFIAALAFLATVAGFAPSHADASSVPVLPWSVGRLEIRPTDKVVVSGDSITARNWYALLQNQSRMLYGDSVVWVNRGASGQSMASYIQGGYAAASVADNPTVVIVALGTNYAPPTIAEVRSHALDVIDYFQSRIPAIRMAWVGVSTLGSEVWNPDPYQAQITVIDAGLRQACAARGVQYIDVRPTWLAAQARYNLPSPGVSSGVLTVEGLHPNFLGNAILGLYVRTQIAWGGITYPAPDPATYTASTDATPFLDVQAKNITGVADGDPISTLSPNSWAASTTARPTYRATGWANGAACIEWDGTSDVMTAPGLSVPSGAKTFFQVAKGNAFTSFGVWQTLANLKVSTGVYSEVAPTWNYVFDTWFIGGDIRSDGSTGYPVVHPNYPLLSDTAPFGVPMGATYSGGRADATGSYTYSWGGSMVYGASDPAAPAYTGFAGPVTATTGVTSLGARMNNGTTGDHYFAGKSAAVLGYPGVLAASPFARIMEMLRRDYGPGVLP